jgi:NADH-quinone oxidoreductase subunit H
MTRWLLLRGALGAEDDMLELLEYIPPWLPILLIVHFAVLGTVAYLILLERKTASWVQDRIGPNRVGPFGLLQPIADGLKFILKEDYRPKQVDGILFSLAPIVMIVVIIVSIAVIPWGGIKGTTTTIDITPALAAGQGIDAAVEEQARQLEQGLPRFHEVIGNVTVQRVPAGAGLSSYADLPTIVVDREDRFGESQTLLPGPGESIYATYTTGWRFQIANLNIGVLFVLATLSLAVYGVVIGGWASNNKYSFLGGLRATANMISYEIPLGLTVLAIVVIFGTLDLGEIVEKQAHYWGGWIPAWNVFAHPLGFFMFLICIHAEANRAPFDTAEAEQELVGGYHTEYSSMRFALFFLAEYAGMITTSAVLVALFLGGWHFPGLTGADPNNPAVTDSIVIAILRSVVFFVKTIFVLFIFMWVRWSIPRFRFDQIMTLAWRGLIPVALAILLATAFTIYFFGGQSEAFRSFRRMDGWMAAIMLLSNIVILAIIMFASTLLPAGPNLNRKVRVPGSRYDRIALPGRPVTVPAAAQHAAGDTGPAGAAMGGKMGDF